MFAIIALVLVVLVAVALLSLAAHVLFSPWLLLLVGIGILAWVKFGPRRSRQ
jgi:hypothetical protein